MGATADAAPVLRSLWRSPFRGTLSRCRRRPRYVRTGALLVLQCTGTRLAGAMGRYTVRPRFWPMTAISLKACESLNKSIDKNSRSQPSVSGGETARPDRYNSCAWLVPSAAFQAASRLSICWFWLPGLRARESSTASAEQLQRSGLKTRRTRRPDAS
jgi:hypothetical protein